MNRDTNYQRKAMSYHGKAIRIGGKEFERGLMVCPAGRPGVGVFVVGLKTMPQVKGMSAWIGIDDAVKTMGSTEFIVDVFANGKWERAFKSEVLTVDNAAIKVEVEFPAGTEFVRLIATDGGNGGSADHAVWADARFTE